MSNFDDFLNNLNSANQNDGPEEKEEANFFDLNFEGSTEPQNAVPSEEPVTPDVPEEVVETSLAETEASNDELFSFAQEDETVSAEEAPAEGLFNFGTPAEEPAHDAVPAEEAPAEGLFNFGTPAEEPAHDAVPAEEAPAEGLFNFGAPAEEPAQDAAPEEEFVEEVVEETEEEVSDEASAFDFGGFAAAETSTSENAEPSEMNFAAPSEEGIQASEENATENPAESAAAAAEAPKPVKRIVRRAKPKKKHTVVGELIKIVLGALMAFPLAHYIVWGSYLAFGKPAPGGLYKFPTPFIQASYKYAKNFPNIPVEVWKYTMLGFDAERDLAPDEPEVIPVENPRQVAQTAAPDQKPVEETADESEEFGEDAFNGFEMDEDEVNSAAAAATKFDSANIPEFDASMINPEWDPANLEAFQDTMMKISFLKKGDDFEKVAKEKIAKFGSLKEAKELNKTMKPLLKKENHGKGVLVVGKIVKTSKISGKTVMTVKLKGLEKDVKIMGPAPKNGKGKEFIFTGVVFDPTQDEAINAKNVYIWRGIFKSVDKKKKEKEVKEAEPAAEEPAPADEPAPA
ncbi:MAG: hypothetical protein Q4A17_13555, partial [Thermoguttaceae bacterium]|nr:hypothetical protein [Thermoguttaceae bacterium]